MNNLTQRNDALMKINDESKNESIYFKEMTIEQMIYNQNQEKVEESNYYINNQGADNRRRLFSSNHDFNFFQRAKSTNQDIIISDYPDKVKNIIFYEFIRLANTIILLGKQIEKISIKYFLKLKQSSQGNRKSRFFVYDGIIYLFVLIFSSYNLSKDQTIDQFDRDKDNNVNKSQEDSKTNTFRDSQNTESVSSLFIGQLSRDKRRHDTNLIEGSQGSQRSIFRNQRPMRYNTFILSEQEDQQSKVIQASKFKQKNQSFNKSAAMIVDQPNNIYGYKNHLISLTYLIKFVKQLLLRVAYKDYRILQKKQLQIISDQSIIDLGYINKMYELNHEDNIIKRRNNVLQLQKGLQKEKEGKLKIIFFNFFYNYIYLQWLRSKALNPSTLVIIIWEIFFLSLLIFQLMILPIKGCFQQVQLDSQYYSFILYQIPILCFIIDIIFGFHTGYYELGKPIMNKKKIAINYLYHKFWIDFSCTLLLSFNLYFGSNMIDFLAMFLRINQMKIKIKKIDQHFRLSYRYAFVTSILKLIFLIVILAHLTGCGFHLVGDYSNQLQNRVKYGNDYYYSWIHYSGLQDQDWFNRYIWSIYFSIITMITIGYGDIVPINLYEKIYVIGMTFISCATFAYCINTIGNIFAERHKKQKDFESNQYQLQSYLDYMECSQETQLRVLKYFEYLNEQQDEVVQNGQLVFTKCPPDLKEEIIQERNQKLLKLIPLFNKNFSNEFINLCAKFMEEKRIGPGEKILMENQIPQFLVIIVKGEAEYFFQNLQNKRPLQLIQGKALGLKQFLTETPIPLAIRAKTVSTIIQIPYTQFVNLIKNFSYDFELFCQIRDQMIFENRFIEQCYSCLQYGHDISDCPQIHYKAQNFLFAKKVFHSKQQKRDVSFMRQKTKEGNTWEERVHVAMSLKMKRLELVQEIYQDYNDICISDLIQIQEQDKFFFKRFPKIKQEQINRVYCIRKKTQSIHQQNQQNNQIDLLYSLSKSYNSYDSDQSQNITSSSDSCESENSICISDAGQKKLSKQPSSAIMNDLKNRKTSELKNITENQLDVILNQINDEDVNKSKQSSQIRLSDLKKKNHSIQLFDYLMDYLKQQKNPSESAKNEINKQESSEKLHDQKLIVSNSVQNENNSNLDFLRINFSKENVSDDKNSFYQNTSNDMSPCLSKYKQIQSIQQNQEKYINQKSIDKKFLQILQKQSNQINQLRSNLKNLKGNEGGQPNINLTVGLDQNSQEKLFFNHYLQIQQFLSSWKVQMQKQLNTSSLKPNLKSLTSIKENRTQSQRQKSRSNKQDSEIPLQKEQIVTDSIQLNYVNNNFFGKLGLGFENVKDFQYYFPKFNMLNIIKGYRKILQRQQQKQIKQSGYFFDKKSAHRHLKTFLPRNSIRFPQNNQDF